MEFGASFMCTVRIASDAIIFGDRNLRAGCPMAIANAFSVKLANARSRIA